MDSQEYWKRRQIEREQKWHELTTRELSKLRKYYISAGKEIEKEIALLYAKFARENKLPPEEARRLIRGDEFKAWRMTLEEYVAASKSNPKILRELNTLAMRSRISRIEAIHAKTLMEIISLGERLQETADNHLYRAYLDTYYQNLYDYHKTVGLTTPPASLDKARVESVLQTAWVGKNYSKRIWANTTQLTKEIQRSMLTAIHRGSSIQQLSSELSRRMSVGYKNAERLIRTELNSVENRASAAAMKEAEFDSYQFVAAMDRRTCPRCGEKDGEVFALADMNQGENAPPLHPRCRCTIVATFDTPKGKSRKTGERAAREVPRERVPSDMTYRDWKAIYIDKSKTFESWRAETEAQYKKQEAEAAKSKLGARNYDCELAKTIGKDHYGKMRDIVETTQHSKAAQVWCKFEDRVNPTLRTDDRAFQQGSKIYFNLDIAAAGTTVGNPYQVIFHESGHFIDWLKSSINNAKRRYEYFSQSYRSEAFLKAIDKDLKKLIDAKIAEIGESRLPYLETISKLVDENAWRELLAQSAISWEDFHELERGYLTEAQKSKIIKRILKGQPSKEDALKALTRELRAKHELLERADLSDVIDGYSGGKYNLGAGHKPSYWRGGKAASRATEAFAEFFDSAIANPESYALLKKYLPTAEQTFNEMLDELLKVN